MYDPIYESVKILKTINDGSFESTMETEKIKAVLEDVNSPTTRKFQEKILHSVMNKAHIDFGDIPKSQGNIRKYSGYPSMVDTLEAIKQLALEEKNKDCLTCVAIVTKAIETIGELSSTFERGFAARAEYVALEYNTYVYFCVEATTSLIYSYVDYMKDPDAGIYVMKIKNTKLRADQFYFDRLKEFNAAQDKLGINYRKMLEAMIDNGKSNMIGIAEVVGIGAVVAATLAIVPISREILYQIYKFRGKLSENLEIQANFLELNKTCLQNNEIMDNDKKRKVMARQDKLIKKLRNLSDKLRVKAAKSIMDSKKDIENENKRMSINSIRDEVSNSPFEII